jgi:pimeloyl-ACP methyl ester carboxylesterase
MDSIAEGVANARDGRDGRGEGTEMGGERRREISNYILHSSDFRYPPYLQGDLKSLLTCEAHRRYFPRLVFRPLRAGCARSRGVSCLFPAHGVTIMRPGTAVHRQAFASRLPGAGLPSGTVWFLVVILLSVSVGCSSSKYLTLRKVPRNPLEGPLNLLSRQGPRPTERTVQTLRRYDLEKLYQRDPASALGKLQEEIAHETTADKIHAFSELAYIAGYKAEALGKHPLALNLYGAAAFHAYDYLFDPSYDSLRNPYDPQFRRACDLYNGALEAALRLMQRNDQLRPGESLLVDTGAEQIRVDVVVLGSWKAEDIDRLEFVSDYQLKGLKNHHHSFGLGVPLIAVRRPGPPDDPVEKYYPPEMSFPLTAFLRILPTRADQPGRSGRCCVLELHDPMDACTTIVSNRLVPLETDLSTPLGYRLEKQQKKPPVAIATLGLLNPANAASIEGLYMVEPYDPRKIPVLMVHGLWSSPMTWMEMFNDLLAYPEIRANYQFWFYLYPTGEPFWYTANQLRADLAEVRGTLDPHAVNPVFDRMVLVGHSMGGLVSMMQTLNSGDDLWRLMSEVPFEELRAEPDVRHEVSQLVFFEANPSVSRVITLGTPHRGSRFANDYTRYLARKLIRLPSRKLWVTQNLVLENPGVFRDTDLLTISTSIDSLAPDSPILPALLEAERASWVRYHNVVGVIPDDWWLSRFTETGDGIVSLQSARRADFQSELVVEADHMKVHAHPRSILEVRRILLEHLKAGGGRRETGDGRRETGDGRTAERLDKGLPGK